MEEGGRGQVIPRKEERQKESSKGWMERGHDQLLSNLKAPGLEDAHSGTDSALFSPSPFRLSLILLFYGRVD